MLRSGIVLSGNDARQLLSDGGTEDPESLYGYDSFNDSKFIFVQFKNAGNFGLIVSIDRHSGDIKLGKDYFYNDSTNVLKNFRWEQVKNEKTFKNVALYLKNETMGNINRINCREVKIQIGKYAQYDRAINLKWLEKGKSKWRGVWVNGYKPFVVVVPMDRAIEPDSLFGDEELSSTPGVTMRRGRHMSFSSGWTDDFTKALKDKHVPVLWSHDDVK